MNTINNMLLLSAEVIEDHMIHIITPDDERIALYRALRGTPERHTQERIFIAEGEIAVNKLLHSSLQCVSVFAVRRYYEQPHHRSVLMERLQREPLMLFTAEKDVMSAIVGFTVHAGIMAIGKQPTALYLDGCSTFELQRWAESIFSLEPANAAMPIVALNALIDAENVGAIIRTCSALGVRALLVDDATCSPYTRRAVRVSMGGVFSVHIAHCASLSSALHRLRYEAGCVPVAFELTDSAIPFNQAQLLPRSVVVFGSESTGITSDVLQTCSAVYAILSTQSRQPKTTATRTHHSLNVAAASAIVLYQYAWHARSA
jgi:tRNA G18 (ribose-2'-O)-methylase SpoU